MKISFCKMQLFVWNQHSTQPILKYCEHTAAVKAIAWSPHMHGLLASGGGTADRCIRFWNTTTNSHLSCMDTGSQVFMILFGFGLLRFKVCTTFSCIWNSQEKCFLGLKKSMSWHDIMKGLLIEITPYSCLL